MTTNGFHLFPVENPHSAISEAFRTLRTNIQFANLDKPLKKILVTSSGPGEGKTTTVINLAVSLAQGGQETLIVDTDLRKPSVHKAFELEAAPGLTNWLVGQEDSLQIIRPTKIPHLSLISSGPLPPNPAELLSSKRMQAFGDKIKDKFDVILFDSPPVLSVTDSSVLSTLVDGVVFVIKSGSYQRRMIIQSKEQLASVKANILGAVLNCVDLSRDRYYHYYYYYYYRHEEEESETETKKEG